MRPANPDRKGSDERQPRHEARAAVRETEASSRAWRPPGGVACRQRRAGGRFINLPQEAPLARYEQVQRHVIEARYLGDYKVWLEFNDGRKGVVDLSDDLYGDSYEGLRDRDRFADFYLDYGLATIAWHGGVDFASDYLYDRLSAMH
jgi:hypothetical protein